MRPTIHCNSALAAHCRGEQPLICQIENNTLYLHGTVGDGGDQLASRQVVQAIDKLQGPLVIDINSEGGLVFDGIAIYNALVRYADAVTARVTGIAASAASIVAMAAGRVEMGTGGQMLLHTARTLVAGPASILLDVAEQLQQIDQQLAAIYAQRMAISQDEAYEIMRGRNDGTTFDAAGAIEAGLADGMIGQRQQAVALQQAKIRLQLSRVAVD